jgi:NADH dehydrogenase
VKHVVIVGGGFAGLNCARTLASHCDVRITLLDKNNYHQFQPLLYQVASGMLAPGNAAFALRSILQRHSTVDVKMAQVVSVDLKTRTAETAEGQRYQGDFLVLAAGSQVNFFGTSGADQYAYPLYSLQDAQLLRSRILAMLESADRDPSLIAKGALNFVIVGAGPTGTEMAGTLGDMTQRLLKDEYKDLDLSNVRILLVDMGQSVLGTFSEKSQAYATKNLNQRGVHVRLGTAVKQVTSGHVLLSDGTRIPTRTVIWAGGLKASPLSCNLGVLPGHGGRIDVQSDLSVKGFAGVYAIGDFSNIAGADSKPLPQLASVAQQSGKRCATNITAAIAGQPGEPFHYVDKGIMAMIGRYAAVAEIGEYRHVLTGPIAFAAWLGVHAVLLPTARAKVESFVEWAWDYFGKVRGEQVLDRPDQTIINWKDNEEKGEITMAEKLRDQLIGAWKLVSYVEKPVDGTTPTYPMGEKPMGIIMYTPDGYMSAQLMRPDRGLFASGDWFNGTTEEYRGEASTYIAYSGPFHVNEEKRTLTHSMFVSLFPNWTGQTQPRVVKIDGDILHLSTEAPIKSGGKTVMSYLQWRRASKE